MSAGICVTCGLPGAHDHGEDRRRAAAANATPVVLKCLRPGCLEPAVDGFKCEQHSTLRPTLQDLLEQIDGVQSRAIGIIEATQIERDNALRALELVLPMAKAHAHAHDVGSNQSICLAAERVLRTRGRT